MNKLDNTTSNLKFIDSGSSKLLEKCNISINQKGLLKIEMVNLKLLISKKNNT